MLSTKLEPSLRLATSIAESYNHEFITVEHLSLALLEDEEIHDLINHISPRYASVITKKLETYLRNKLSIFVKTEPIEPKPSPEFQKVVQRAVVFVKSIDIGHVNTLHVLAEIVIRKELFACRCFNEIGVTKSSITNYMMPIFNVSSDEHQKKTQENILQFDHKNNQQKQNDTLPEEVPNILSEFCSNMNEKAIKGKLDLVIGRQEEIQRCIEILCRRQKSNAILLGDAGVGKTAIAEGIAKAIIDKKVPQIIKDKVIYSMDVANIVAGTRYRGDFEARIQNLLEELKKRPEIILFIDEIHLLVGAGSTNNSALDASNMFKPALARGDISCIGATTNEEYSKYIESDTALIRRFQKIQIKEPSVKDTLEIINGIKHHYEEYHQVEYTNDAINASVTLADRYITDRKLPDKAIDIIDEAGARKNIFKENNVVAAKDIEQIIALMVDMPILAIADNEAGIMQDLDKKLSEVIFGQEQSIKQLVNSIKAAKIGLDMHGEVRSYLFAGPAGVGKKELAKSLAKSTDMKLQYYDMKNYSDSSDAIRLFGKGHVDIEHFTFLSNIIKSPRSIILLDEMDHANPDICNILTNIIKDGYYLFGSKKISFKHTIIVMTTNINAKSNSTLGFTRENAEPLEVNHIFTEQFLEYINKVIYFQPLSESAKQKIINKDLDKLTSKLADKGIKLVVEKNVRKKIENYIMNTDEMHKSMKELIHSEIRDKVAEEIINGNILCGSKVKLLFTNNQITIVK